MEHTDIIDLILKAKSSTDETELDLLKDLVETAIKYTNYRANWFLWSNEERATNDSYRTTCHNRFIDALNIFLRYERSLGKTAIDVSEWERKIIGDVANELVCAVAILMR